jgi:DNA recombination protein RmuC
MMQAVIAAAAALAGILLGFWMRSNSARSEKALLEQQNQKAAADLAAARSELAASQSAAAARAGFESLAIERQLTIDRLVAERDAAQRDVQAEKNTTRAQAARISELEALLSSEKLKTLEKIALLGQAEKKFADTFEALANNVLEKKSGKFSEQSKTEIDNLLKPLRDQLKEFRERVEKVQNDSTAGVSEIKTLIGTLGDLNRSLSKEAHNLATALRGDTKAQGNWGETILRNILEKSGLQEGPHYTFQQSFTGTDEDGGIKRNQTDVIIKLPSGRHLIIDSKVSLNAYQDSVNSQDEKARTDATKRHVASMRGHYVELSNRNYHSLPGIESPDFVVMFVPIEPAFLQALQDDDSLWMDAYQRRVLLCGPTTVLFVIGIVADLWRQEKQARSVVEVMDQGAKLYVKFAAFVNDMDDLGKSLRNANSNFENAKKKLSEGKGNLIGGMERLSKMGLKPKFSKSSKPVPAAWLASSKEGRDEEDDVEIPILAASVNELGDDETSSEETV